MNRYVCIHGHFYQPPRENPWLEAVEQQDSAYPFHDWDARVTEECYLPNGRSRILDGEGWIVSIVNNYVRISFNFGPTVLSWMAEHAPEPYSAILEADRLSRERFGGHGSAIAQSYSHLIMPLANDRDRRTQVRWGIRDFEERFGRRPEGMWLPETAVNIATLEALAEQEILFTILAPRQASRVRRIGESDWTDVSPDAIDPTRAYRQTLPSGRTISLFFYDGPISQAVAFERLLNSGNALSDRIMGALPESPERPTLAHIATDGETYGHHHRRGDMALAYALQRIEEDESVELINYGSFLEKHPPEYEVEIAENTSWSCYHGVERWRSDCGCQTGAHQDWNQAWRAPLRAALDWLRDEVAPVYEQQAGRLLKDPWASRDAYIDVILDRSDETLARFFEEHAGRELEEVEQSTALQLLEMQRHAMLMYTSCGWFFDELSGIETVQVIAYAGRVIQIARDACGLDVEAGFLERLAEAHSNLPKQGNGRDIYERYVKPAVLDLPAVAAHSAISSLFDDDSNGDQRVYCYDTHQTLERDLRAGRARLRIGCMDVISRITRRSDSFRFAVVHLGDHVVSGGVRPLTESDEGNGFAAAAEAAFHAADFVGLFKLIEERFGEATYSLRSLFRDQQRAIVDRLLESTMANVRETYRGIYDRHASLLRFHSGLRIQPPRELRVAAELVLNDDLRRALEEAPEGLERIARLVAEAEGDRTTLDEALLSFSAENAIERLAGEWLEEPESLERLAALDDTVQAIAQFPFEVDREEVQNVLYRIMEQVRPKIAARETEDARQWLERFDALAQRLRIRVHT